VYYLCIRYTEEGEELILVLASFMPKYMEPFLRTVFDKVIARIPILDRLDFTQEDAASRSLDKVICAKDLSEESWHPDHKIVLTFLRSGWSERIGYKRFKENRDFERKYQKLFGQK
jgi:hypothetical protein